MVVIKKAKRALVKSLFLLVSASVYQALLAGQQSTEPVGNETFVGIWQYRDTGELSYPHNYVPKHYLKITQEAPGKFRLIEGFKDGFSLEKGFPFVGDEDTIDWLAGKNDVISLKLSGGKLQGSFISGNFRPTHGQKFTYKLTIEPTAKNKIRYAMWSSIRGGETETFEATRVDVAGATKGSGKSTGQTDEPIRIGVVQDTSAIGGCSCYFSPMSPGGKTGSEGHIFFADYAGKGRMNINGRDVELREVGREQAKGELGRCSKNRCKYAASGINATVDYRETNKCPPEPTECEVTGYDVTITVEKGGHRQKVIGKGECGC